MSRNQPDRSLVYAFGTIAVALLTLMVTFLLASIGTHLESHSFLSPG